MNTFLKITLISLLTITLVQCKTQKVITKTETNEKKEHDHSSHSHGEEKHEHKYMASPTEADTMKSVGFNVLYFCYFKLSEELRKDNKTRAADYAGSMFRAIDNITFEDKTSKTALIWQARKQLIKDGAMYIANSADDIAKQRSFVSQLSLNILELIKTDNLNSPVYHFYCKKVNDYKGGNWLSKEDNMETNPFQNNIPEPCGHWIEVIKK